MNWDLASPRFLLTFAFAILAVHFINQLTLTYPLMFDEVQYWFWGKHPAFGYYSKPPLIAWLMGASTALFGDSAAATRLFAPLLLLGAAAMLYATARLLGRDRETSGWVFVTFLTLPIVTGGSAFFTTDVPLIFCWSVALYAVLRTIHRPHENYWWLLAGIAAGFGLLSKYTMVGFALSVAVALLIDTTRRRTLTTLWPWFGALLALAIFAPNLWWNAQHQFVTFNHTEQNVLTKNILFYPLDTLIFIAAQFFLFGPLMLVALLRSLRDARHDATLKLLHCFFWPVALAGVVVCFLAGAQVHWIAPAYVAGTLIAVLWLSASGRMAWLRWSLLIHLIILAAFYAAPSMLPRLPVSQHSLDRVYVWNQLTEPVARSLSQHPGAVVMTEERKIAAALTYGLRNLRGVETPVAKWPTGQVRDHYDLLSQHIDYTGKPVLLVTRNEFARSIPNAQLLQHITIASYRFEVYFIPSFLMPVTANSPAN